MLFGDVPRKAVGWHLFAAEPAEGATGRDVDAVASNTSMRGLFAYIKG
jgi:hypothetical protein